MSVARAFVDLSSQASSINHTVRARALNAGVIRCRTGRERRNANTVRLRPSSAARDL